MASRGKLHPPIEPLNQIESDYGSDLDDDDWDAVLSQVESQPLKEVAIEDLVDPIISQDASNPHHGALRLSRARVNPEARIDPIIDALAAQTSRIEVEYDRKVKSGTASTRLEDDNKPEEQTPEPQAPAATSSTRSPMQRFRTPPKKPLSVTDIVSPAWCELQYWYSLTRYGRVRRTPAMKQGSTIHKQKEREVHVEVPIEAVTPEDRLGLRLWNTIHGLRTLRTTGLTRELEVLGLIDGEVIVGIVDEITTSCPDVQAEDALLRSDATGMANPTVKATLPPDQRIIQEYFADSRGATTLENSGPPLGVLQHDKSKTYYLVDIKTRQTDRLPSDGQMKPTRIQLMLYRRLLLDLATNHVAGERVFARYGVNPHQTFSDTFIAGLASLDSATILPAEPDSLDEITTHNTLGSLWTLMIDEFVSTFPIPNSSNSLGPISPLLTVEYRKSDSGALIGRKPFGVAAPELDTHVSSTMQWWRGERPARGVEVEEAWKCGICEFAPTCTWRADKIGEATKTARMRQSASPKSSA